MKNSFLVYKEMPKKFFDLIPQKGVTHLLCEEFPRHNAVWDMAIRDDGRVFFSVCAENFFSEYARLYEYDHKNKRLIHHYNLWLSIEHCDIRQWPMAYYLFLHVHIHVWSRQ